MQKKDIDWSKLGFGYVKTDKRFVAHYKDGKWDEGHLTDDEMCIRDRSMVQLVSSVFTFVGIVAMMIILSPTLFAFALVFLIIMLVIVSRIGKQSRKYFRQQQKNLGVIDVYKRQTEKFIPGVKNENRVKYNIGDLADNRTYH